MPIAIQEDMLTGSTLLEKFEHARALGVPGIEFRGAGLTEKVPEIAGAMAKTGVVASAVNHGHQGDLLSPDPAEREHALARLRQSVMNACDIGAPGVIFVPHFGAPVLPDLSPWMSAGELEIEMLYMHLRTLSDFGEAMGIDLYIQPATRAETHLINRLEQAAAVTRRLKHPRVRVVAGLYGMAREESDVPSAIRAHADCIGYVHLADRRRGLPAEGAADFAAAAAALADTGYSGWAAYDCGIPGSSDPAAYRDGLPRSLDYVRRAGIS